MQLAAAAVTPPMERAARQAAEAADALAGEVGVGSAYNWLGERGRIMAIRYANLLMCLVVLFGPGVVLGNETDLLVNGNFDSGPGAPWIENNGPSGYELIVTSDGAQLPAQSGAYLAWLGGVDSETHRLWQDVAVPSSATRLKLTGYRWISTEEPVDIGYDAVTIELRTPSGDLLESLVVWTNVDHTGGWYGFELNAGEAHAGETVRLELTAVTDSNNKTSFFFDTLALVAADDTGASRTSWGSVKSMFRR